jgi:hypothetical protein
MLLLRLRRRRSASGCCRSSSQNEAKLCCAAGVPWLKGRQPVLLTTPIQTWYWAFVAGLGGNNLEISYSQEIGLIIGLRIRIDAFARSLREANRR